MLLILLNRAVGQGKDIAWFRQRIMESHPDDPAFDILLTRHYAELGNFRRVHQVIDRLDENVGGDPYLNTIRATYLMLEGKLDDAAAAAGKTIAAEPTLLFPYEVLTIVSLKKHDFEKAVQVMQLMHNNFGVPFEAFEGFEKYDSLSQSEAFRRWQRQHDK